MPITRIQCSKYMRLAKEKPALLSNDSPGNHLDINSELKLLSLDDDKAKGKKGKGLAAYAENVGKESTSIKQWSNAASVYLRLSDTCHEVREKPRHLYEISKAPQESCL